MMTLLAEFLVGDVEGLANTIRVEHQAIARTQLDGARRVSRTGQHSQHRAAFAELFDGAIAAAQDGRIVTGVAVVETHARRIDTA